MKFFKISLFIFSIPFLFSCSGNLKLLDQMNPVTNPLSRMDFPVYFGKVIPNEFCLNKIEDVGVILSEHESSSSISDYQTEIEEEQIYKNSLTQKIETLDQKKLKIFLPIVRIRKHRSLFWIIFSSMENNSTEVSIDINCCKNKK